jgi:hypothetical protein
MVAAVTVSDVFTPQGLAAQLPFLLLVLAILSTRYKRARAMVAAGAMVGLSNALLVDENVVAAFWWGLLMVASLMVLGRRLFENATTRFSEEEQGMLADVLSTLPRPHARHLLDRGFWLSGRDGDVLTREGEPVTHLFYLAAGEARVLSHGRQVGTCRVGDLVGEVTVLSGDKASATVVLDGPARFWCAPATVLRPYLKAHDDVRVAIEQGFAASVKAKLRASNELIAEAGGVAA